MRSPPPSAPQAEKAARNAEPEGPLSPAESQTLHELQVHQVELEMQNEELRRAHAELDLARSRYFDLYDLAPVGYCTLSPQGLVVQANLTAVTMLGMPRKAVLDRAFSRFIHQDDQSVLHSLLQRVPEQKDRASAELRVVREDGSLFWAQLVVTLARSEAGMPERRVVLSDVTARREAEAARQQGEVRYQDLFSRASDGIVLCAVDGKLLEVNQAFARMHGCSREQLIGSSLKELDTKGTTLEPARLKRMALGETLTFEVAHQHPDGKELPLEVSVSQVSINGRPRLLAFYRDITERKQLHAGLAQNDRLTSMGMLAAGVAHEINNPLSYVLSSVEDLARDLPGVLAEPSKLGELVEQASAALEGLGRIRKISRSLATFSRAERSGLERVDVNRALEGAATMAKNEIKFRATLLTDLAPLPQVVASESRLTQVFLNLILNAAQAIDEGHVAQNRITLRTWASDGEVFAEVSDTGRGISAENLLHIFEPFFTTRRGVGGTGLGLAICKTIMSELGGDLRVESVTGKGTRFVVRLSSRLQLEEAPVLPPPAIAPTLRRGRILVVDDELPIRNMMRRLLGSAHEVVVVDSGEAARALLLEDPAFDVVLCDLMMPEMTGMELHAWMVKESPDLARRVIFVSGGAFTPNASIYLQKVPNLKLEKPFDAEELRSAVALLLANGPGA